MIDQKSYEDMTDEEKIEYLEDRHTMLLDINRTARKEVELKDKRIEKLMDRCSNRSQSLLRTEDDADRLSCCLVDFCESVGLRRDGNSRFIPPIFESVIIGRVEWERLCRVANDAFFASDDHD